MKELKALVEAIDSKWKKTTPPKELLGPLEDAKAQLESYGVIPNVFGIRATMVCRQEIHSRLVIEELLGGGTVMYCRPNGSWLFSSEKVKDAPKKEQ